MVLALFLLKQTKKKKIYFLLPLFFFFFQFCLVLKLFRKIDDEINVVFGSVLVGDADADVMVMLLVKRNVQRTTLDKISFWKMRKHCQ